MFLLYLLLVFCLSISNVLLYDMVSSTSRQNEPNLYCEWLSQQARYSHLASWFPAVSLECNYLSLFTFKEEWILASFLCCLCVELNCIVIHKDCKTLYQYKIDILTSHLVNNPCVTCMSLKAAEKQGSAEETVQQLQTQVQDLQAELNRVRLVLVVYSFTGLGHSSKSTRTVQPDAWFIFVQCESFIVPVVLPL